MRAPAVSFANKLWAATLAALLTFTLVPASALAEGEGDSADAATEEPQEISAEQADEGSGSTPVASTGEGGTLASVLVGTPTTFINSDVVLDGEPVIGSFTVDGMTFAVVDGMTVELVGVSPDRQQVASSQEGDSSPVAPMLASGPNGLEADSSTLALPESITYEGIDYAVTSVGAYAFYLSGVASIELSASIAQVDDRAFRSSDVASVSVADGNPSYSSFDGALYDADQTSLLLIPEGKQGTVLLPKTAESAAPSVFSHCPLVTQIAVEEGSAAFASENGLLYDASLTTLLRVPAGATDIVIRDGCTTIAAGALEACASLATITAPASVTSISPDVFTSVPTVSLPAETLAENAPQLTALVALVLPDDSVGFVDEPSLKVFYGDTPNAIGWDEFDSICDKAEMASMPTAEMASMPTAEMSLASMAYAATIEHMVYVNDFERGYLTCTRTYNTEGPLTSEGAEVWIHTGNPLSYRFTSTGVGTTAGVGTYALYAGADYVIQSVNGGYTTGNAYARPGYKFMGWSTSDTATTGSASLVNSNAGASPHTFYAIFMPTACTIVLDAQGGRIEEGADIVSAEYGKDTMLPQPMRPGYAFKGWSDVPDGSGELYDAGAVSGLPIVDGARISLYAQWEPSNFDVSFDTSSEPGDEDYPGIEKPDETVNVESGPTVIEDPQRPGYVFQGWTIPNADGTEAIDQDLVYQDEADGKWYVDTSKLPDYANDEGRVELTARWTSVISVDVPGAVTFYADVVTQGNESREGAASSAFGQNKVASQSEVDLRIVGLESTAVETQGSTLGADSILKKSDAATPSSSTQKLFSLYPTDKALTADDLQDPDAVSAAKPADAVDFALDDILLEKSFAADAFTIPAGDTLNLGYRLNLAETGTELDYDTLATLDEGASASIANISYCFAADWTPFWTYDNDGRKLDVDAIKVDAEAIAAGDSATTAKYTAWMNADHRFYVRWFDQGMEESADPTAATVYDVRIIGLNHDDKSDGSGKAGITFQFVDCLKDAYRMNQGNVATSAWIGSELRARMNPGTSAVASGTDDDAIWSQVPTALADRIVQVDKTVWTGTSAWIVPYQSATVTSSTAKASDRLFLVPEAGMRRLDTYPNYTMFISRSTLLEGPLYGYYDPIVPSGYDVWEVMAKRFGPDGGSANWWCCSHSPNPANTSGSFISIDGDGGSSHATTASTALGICPAFCL